MPQATNTPIPRSVEDDDDDVGAESVTRLAIPPPSDGRIRAVVVTTLRDSDRRRAPRVELVVPVAVSIGDEVLEGESQDISVTGMFVRLQRLLPAGRRVRLALELQWGRLEADAVIVRFRTPMKGRSGGVGVCFVDLTDEQRELIAMTCDTLPALPDEERGPPNASR